MKFTFVFLTLNSLHLSVNCFINPYPRVDGELRDGDAGEPLFLTKYIENGDIAEGRRLARVPFTESLRIKSYAGFFTVNKTYDSNHFFWYFPASAPGDPSLAPVILWLQGGPGASSLYGLFTENGPLRVRQDTFERRKYNWALNHHLIYIDNPVGTGFSFTKNPGGFVTTEDQVGRELYSSMLQFFKLFPELSRNKFFITGESYAGKYVPALGYTIHKNNPQAQVKINLKGLAIGNGLSDPVNQLVYSKYLYQIGLIDSNGAAIFNKYEQLAVKYIKGGEWEQAFNTFDMLLNGDLIKGESVFHNVTGFNYYFNYLHTCSSNDSDAFGRMLQKNTIREAIHVGNLSYNNGTLVENHLKLDVMQSVAPILSVLLSHYNVLIYNGQLDIIVAYPLTVNYLKQLNFSGAEEYAKAERHIWRVDGEVAGYVKQAGRLIEVMVRNAGHMVPADQPKWALDLITRFTHEKSFNSASKKLINVYG